MRKKLCSRIAMLLCVVTLMISVVSCKKDQTENPDETKTDQTQTDQNLVETDENGYVKDSLPESANLDREFTIYAWQEQKAWEWCDEETAPTGVLDQALFRREHAVEERFGVTILRDYHPGSWDDRGEFIQDLATRINLNDHSYDLVDQYLPAAGIGAMQGLYVDLMNVPNLDFSKPWWPSRLTETASIGSKLYFASGDISPTFLINTHCIFANTTLYRNYGLDQYVDGRSIFDVVRDYDWTLETMLLLARDKVDTSVGNYGFTADNVVQADGFFYGGDFLLLETNGDGFPQLSPDLSSQLLSDWYDDIQKLFTDEYSDVKCTGDPGITPFQTKKSIFHASTLSNSRKFAEEGLTFTALPMPMRDSQQQQYSTTTNFWVSMFSIPADANLAESGMIMEALASQAYRGVTSVVYYNLFQMRYNSTNGADSAAMFDMVVDSVVLDAARMFAGELGMFSAFRNGVGALDENLKPSTKMSWMSIYAASEELWQGNLNSLIASVG